MSSLTLSPVSRAALAALAADLQRVFGDRLQSVVAYVPAGQTHEDEDAHSLAVVERLIFADLAAAAPMVKRWRASGLAVPLILERDEFQRTLDVFPVEYGDIIAHHVLIAGNDPFAGARVSRADLRRACELAAKSHLIHLREGFLETGGDPQQVARLIAASAHGFRTLLATIARLRDDATGDVAADAERQVGVPAALIEEVAAAAAGRYSTIPDPTALLARYIEAAERVWHYVDQWRQP